MQGRDNVDAARMVLERRGEVPETLLSWEIGASWNRCLQAGLDPTRPPSWLDADPAAWHEARGRHERVRRLARAELEGLHGQIAGSNSLIAFAAPDGTVLDAITDDSFRGQAQDRALEPGACWRETLRGTNAMGLAATLKRSAVVHGAEHFFRADTGLTCVAEPVWGADGELAGVLDASTSSRTRQLHTRALMRMAAAQIGNTLFREHHRDCLMLAIHGREEFLFTSGAGLLALDGDGQILGASAQGLVMLHGLPVEVGRGFGTVFAARFGEVVASRPAGEAFRLRDRAGSIFFAAVVTRMPGARPVAVRDRSVAGSGRREAPARAPGTTSPAAGLVAEDPVCSRAVLLASAAARRRLPILIDGETGTGKEELARVAHAASGREGRFVPVNCAALPGELVEAELFGYAEGAFTGARRGGAAGLVAEAHGGTLFLDEIGDMPVRAQATLLRLLDDWTVRPLGGGSGRAVDVLLVAATNVALHEAVREGKFRPDLLHRLAVVSVTLPRLADRQDFATLARTVLARIDPALRLTDGAVALLRRQRWDGNVRELRNVLTRASLAAVSIIDPAVLLQVLPPEPVVMAALGPAVTAQREAATERLDSRMVRAIRDEYKRCGGSVSETARRLDVSRNRVYRALRHGDKQEGS